MGQAQEVEAGPIRLRIARILSAVWAEVDEARLVGMEGESIPCQTLAQDRQHPFGIEEVVERHQRVVGVPDKGALPSQTRLTSVSNHSSSTWCRKMFERQGEITPPCGEPSVVRCRRPSSTAPAFSHLSIILG